QDPGRAREADRAQEQADPAWFGIAVATIDGHVYEVGDSSRAATGTLLPAAEAGPAAWPGRGGARGRAARRLGRRAGTPLAALPTVAGVRVAFDEMLEGDLVRPPWRAVHDWLAKASPGELERRRREAELRFRRLGITFSVGSEGGDSDRLIP